MRSDLASLTFDLMVMIQNLALIYYFYDPFSYPERWSLFFNLG